MRYSTKTKYMRNGDFMTRICAIANNQQCAVSADTMLTNTETNEKTYRKKILYKKGIIISLSGTLELFAGPIRIDFIEYFQEYLNRHDGEFGLSDIDRIETELSNIFAQYPYYQGLCINFYWIENKTFRTYCYEIVTDEKISLGSLIKYPFGKLREDNKDLYIFNNHILHCGEGVDGIYVLNCFDVNPVEAKNIVEKAIINPDLSTVGGQCQTIVMNLDGSVSEIIE